MQFIYRLVSIAVALIMLFMATAQAGYVANDPINHTDPDGRCIDGVCIGVGLEQTIGGISQQRQIARDRVQGPVGAAVTVGVVGAAAACATGGCATAGYVAIEGMMAEAAGAGIASTAGMTATTATVGAAVSRTGALNNVAEGAMSAVQSVAKGVSDFLGEGAKVVRDDAKGFVALSEDGTKRFRLDIEGHGHAPHAHIEQKTGKRFKDATDEHRLYFKDDE